MTNREEPMTAAAVRTFIRTGKWVSIAPELRPSISKSAAGSIQPFYLIRAFTYPSGDQFECTIINYADSNATIPLVKIVIKGHLVWQGDHPIAPGAQKVDYVADGSYEVTPLHPGFTEAINKFPSPGLEKWETGATQDVKGKEFLPFGLTGGTVYIDYDLIYIYNGMLFNGSKNVDGRAFDKPENRPTNLQLPLIRQ